MNARVLELIKNPENIQSEDLKLLEYEIKSKPYIQNIRALHLFGIHRFNPENYQNELSKTAAYTTDKKILYHFINKNSFFENESLVNHETVENSVQESLKEYTSHPQIQAEEKNISEMVFVNGERNRILFEGEEGFIETTIQQTEDEADAEAESLVNIPEMQAETSDAEEPGKYKAEISESEAALENETFEPQFSEGKIIKEAEPSIEDKEDNSTELSFHGIDTFLPNIAVPVDKKVENYPPKQNVNRHEEDMRRLIAEVEAKIKAKKQSQSVQEKNTEEEFSSSKVSFAETQNFHLEMSKQKSSEEIPLEEKSPSSEADQMPKKIQAEIKKETEKIETPVQNSSWKPMSLASNIPDSLIQKTEIKKDGKPFETRKETATKTEERHVLNVSFFAPNVSKIGSEEKAEVKTEDAKEEIKTADSNVPRFINTWQNWLKLERKEPEPSKEEIKEKAIEKFIENEPKISKLKEEAAFVVKEKTDDISHLMTETLAKLYVEQRLYSKSIKAYEVLQKKHPEKSDYFAEKIEEVKSLRANKQP